MQSRSERSLFRFALILCILRDIGDEKSRCAVGAYQYLPCVLWLLCEERTEPQNARQVLVCPNCATAFLVTNIPKYAEDKGEAK